MTVTANQGSIYANAITATGQVLDTSALVVKSGLYDGSIQAQRIFNHTLHTANSQFNDTSKGDRVEIIQIGNVNARSTAASRIFISPNDAYI